MAPSDATEKNCDIRSQLQSILYTTAQKRFWKTYILYDFWCAQTCSFRAIFGLHIRTFTHAVSVIGCDMRKNFFIHVHIYILGPKLLQWNFFVKSLSCLYEVVRTNFSADFWTFRIFDRNFAKIVAPLSDEYANYVVRPKEQSLLKKRCKPRRNRPINGNAMFVRTMHPSNARCSRLGAWPKKTRICHVPAKHANRMDARAHTSTLAECAPRFMTPRSQGFVGQRSPNLAHV